MSRNTRRITLAAALLVPILAVVGLRALDADLTGQAIGDDDTIVGVELSAVQHNWVSSGLSGAALSGPIFAQQVTANGGDPAVVRMQPDGQLRVQEYTGDDAHMNEAIDLLAIPSDLIANHVKGETGTLRVNQANRDVRHTVELQARYSNPVVIMQVGTYSGAQPVHAQVFSTGRTSFTFGLIEPSTYGNGAHTFENVHYAVIEAGRYTLPDGRLLVADTLPMQTSRHDPGEGYVSIDTKNWFDGPVINIVRPQGVDETVFAGGVEGALVGAWAVEDTNNQGMQKALDVRFKRESTWSASNDLQDAIGTMGYVMLGEPGLTGSLEMRASSGGDFVSVDFEREVNGRCQSLAELGLDGIYDVDLTGQVHGQTSVVFYGGEHCMGGAAVVTAEGDERTRIQGMMGQRLWPGQASGGRTGGNGDFASFRVLRTSSAKLTGSMCFNAGEVVLANEFGHLVFQEDGDLVQYRTNKADDTIAALWSSQTAGQAVGGTFCTSDEGDMDLDLIIKDAGGNTVWTQQNQHGQGSYNILELTADCDLRVTQDVTGPGGMWNSDTAGCWSGMPPSVMSAMPDFAFSFSDLDGDGENELVLLTIMQDGKAFLMYDPLGMAHQMFQMGILADQAYLDLLSPTQQATLESQTEAERTRSGSDTPAAMEAMMGVGNLNAQYNAIAMERSGSVAGVDGTIRVSGPHYEYESEPGALGQNFEVYAYSAQVEVSTANGNVTATVTQDETSATYYVAGDGFAIGGGYDPVSVAVVFGDPTGSHIGFGAGSGTGGMLAASWGRDNQYGFSFAIPQIPVGIAIYVSGDDVSFVIDELEDLAISGYAETSDAAVYAWGWAAGHAATAANGTKLWFTAAGSDTRVFFERTANDTSEFFVQSGTSAWQYSVEGTTTAYASVRDAISTGLEEVHNGADQVTDALATAAGTVANSVDVVANVADGVYDAVEDQAQSAAKTVVKFFKKFF